MSLWIKPQSVTIQMKLELLSSSFLRCCLLCCKVFLNFEVGIVNSMICSHIWHKYHDWYFTIVKRNKFETILKYHEWYLCQISRTNHAIICLYYYPYKFVIFTCRYFKLSWNTTALSQSNCRNFSCSSIIEEIHWNVTFFAFLTYGFPFLFLVFNTNEIMNIWKEITINILLSFSALCHMQRRQWRLPCVRSVP